MFEDDWETPSNEVWGDVYGLLHHWRAPSLGAPSFCKCPFLLCSFPFLFTYLFIYLLLLTFLPHDCVVKRRPKLKSKYKSRVNVAIEYAKMIDDFDDFVDLRTLARHCLGP